MSDCKGCGRDEGHYIGCAGRVAPGGRPEGSGAICKEDGCSEPRAVGKGPRPAKYCEQHETGRRK